MQAAGFSRGHKLAAHWPGGFLASIRAAIHSLWRASARSLPECGSAALLLASLLVSHAAEAHASLVSSQPASQALLTEPPHEVTLTFSEPVTPLNLQLIAPSGEQYPLSDIKQVNNTTQVALPSLQESGSYVLSWRVVSADGHPIGGALLFALNSASPEPMLAQHSAPLLAPTIWLSRLLLYMGLFFGVGSLVFRVFAFNGAAAKALDANARASNSTTEQAKLKGLVYVGIAAAILYLGLFGLDALALPWRAIFQRPVWQTALHASVGLAMLLAVGALMLSLLLSPHLSWAKRTFVLQKPLAILCVLLVAASITASGHASTAAPLWLSRPLVWLHGIGVIAWVAALWPLARMPHRLLQPKPCQSQACEPLSRHLASRHLAALAFFSRYIPYALTILVLSGAWLAYRQLTGWSGLVNSSYGQILLAKLLLVLILLALGAYNRYHLTPKIRLQQIPAQRQLTRVIHLEIGLMVLVLALVALWRFTPPPRSAAQAEVTRAEATNSDASHMLELANDDLEAKLSFSANNQLWVQLSYKDHTVFSAQAVTLSFSQPQLGIEPIIVNATLNSTLGKSQQWQVEALNLPAITDWQLEITVLVSDFERLRLQGSVTLPLKYLN